ncbi:unnamed protein product [Amoebophrya sp. A120]|nr:unnamed protein product [Amoebophrya sp. A120]|eukprot:GSA120T00024989001.1
MVLTGTSASSSSTCPNWDTRTRPQLPPSKIDLSTTQHPASQEPNCLQRQQPQQSQNCTAARTFSSSTDDSLLSRLTTLALRAGDPAARKSHNLRKVLTLEDLLLEYSSFTATSRIYLTEEEEEEVQERLKRTTTGVPIIPQLEKNAAVDPSASRTAAASSDTMLMKKWYLLVGDHLQEAYWKVGREDESKRSVENLPAAHNDQHPEAFDLTKLLTLWTIPARMKMNTSAREERWTWCSDSTEAFDHLRVLVYTILVALTIGGGSTGSGAQADCALAFLGALEQFYRMDEQAEEREMKTQYFAEKNSGAMTMRSHDGANYLCNLQYCRGPVSSSSASAATASATASPAEPEFAGNRGLQEEVYNGGSAPSRQKPSPPSLPAPSISGSFGVQQVPANTPHVLQQQFENSIRQDSSMQLDRTGNLLPASSSQMLRKKPPLLAAHQGATSCTAAAASPAGLAATTRAVLPAPVVNYFGRSTTALESSTTSKHVAPPPPPFFSSSSPTVSFAVPGRNDEEQACAVDVAASEPRPPRRSATTNQSSVSLPPPTKRRKVPPISEAELVQRQLQKQKEEQAAKEAEERRARIRASLPAPFSPATAFLREYIMEKGQLLEDVVDDVVNNRDEHAVSEAPQALLAKDDNNVGLRQNLHKEVVVHNSTAVASRTPTPSASASKNCRAGTTPRSGRSTGRAAPAPGEGQNETPLNYDREPPEDPAFVLPQVDESPAAGALDVGSGRRCHSNSSSKGQNKTQLLARVEPAGVPAPPAAVHPEVVHQQPRQNDGASGPAHQSLLSRLMGDAAPPDSLDAGNNTSGILDESISPDSSPLMEFLQEEEASGSAREALLQARQEVEICSTPEGGELPQVLPSTCGEAPRPARDVALGVENNKPDEVLVPAAEDDHDEQDLHAPLCSSEQLLHGQPNRRRSLKTPEFGCFSPENLPSEINEIEEQHSAFEVPLVVVPPPEDERTHKDFKEAASERDVEMKEGARRASASPQRGREQRQRFLELQMQEEHHTTAVNDSIPHNSQSQSLLLEDEAIKESSVIEAFSPPVPVSDVELVDEQDQQRMKPRTALHGVYYPVDHVDEDKRSHDLHLHETSPRSRTKSASEQTHASSSHTTATTLRTYQDYGRGSNINQMSWQEQHEDVVSRPSPSNKSAKSNLTTAPQIAAAGCGGQDVEFSAAGGGELLHASYVADVEDVDEMNNYGQHTGGAFYHSPAFQNLPEVEVDINLRKNENKVTPMKPPTPLKPCKQGSNASTPLKPPTPEGRNRRSKSARSRRSKNKSADHAASRVSDAGVRKSNVQAPAHRASAAVPEVCGPEARTKTAADDKIMQHRSSSSRRSQVPKSAEKLLGAGEKATFAIDRQEVGIKQNTPKSAFSKTPPKAMSTARSVRESKMKNKSATSSTPQEQATSAGAALAAVPSASRSPTGGFRAAQNSSRTPTAAVPSKQKPCTPAPPAKEHLHSQAGVASLPASVVKKKQGENSSKQASTSSAADTRAPAKVLKTSLKPSEGVGTHEDPIVLSDSESDAAAAGLMRKKVEHDDGEHVNDTENARFHQAGRRRTNRVKKDLEDLEDEEKVLEDRAGYDHAEDEEEDRLGELPEPGNDEDDHDKNAAVLLEHQESKVPDSIAEGGPGNAENEDNKHGLPSINEQDVEDSPAEVAEYGEEHEQLQEELKLGDDSDLQEEPGVVVVEKEQVQVVDHDEQIQEEIHQANVEDHQSLDNFAAVDEKPDDEPSEIHDFNAVDDDDDFLNDEESSSAIQDLLLLPEPQNNRKDDDAVGGGQEEYEEHQEPKEESPPGEAAAAGAAIDVVNATTTTVPCSSDEDVFPKMSDRRVREEAGNETHQEGQGLHTNLLQHDVEEKELPFAETALEHQTDPTFQIPPAPPSSASSFVKRPGGGKAEEHASIAHHRRGPPPVPQVLQHANQEHQLIVQRETSEGASKADRAIAVFVPPKILTPELKEQMELLRFCGLTKETCNMVKPAFHKVVAVSRKSTTMIASSAFGPAAHQIAKPDSKLIKREFDQALRKLYPVFLKLQKSCPKELRVKTQTADGINAGALQPKRKTRKAAKAAKESAQEAAKGRPGKGKNKLKSSPVSKPLLEKVAKANKAKAKAKARAKEQSEESVQPVVVVKRGRGRPRKDGQTGRKTSSDKKEKLPGARGKKAVVLAKAKAKAAQEKAKKLSGKKKTVVSVKKASAKSKAAAKKMTAEKKSKSSDHAVDELQEDDSSEEQEDGSAYERPVGGVTKRYPVRGGIEGPKRGFEKDSPGRNRKFSTADVDELNDRQGQEDEEFELDSRLAGSDNVNFVLFFCPDLHYVGAGLNRVVYHWQGQKAEELAPISQLFAKNHDGGADLSTCAGPGTEQLHAEPTAAVQASSSLVLAPVLATIQENEDDNLHIDSKPRKGGKGRKSQIDAPPTSAKSAAISVRSAENVKYLNFDHKKHGLSLAAYQQNVTSGPLAADSRAFAQQLQAVGKKGGGVAGGFSTSSVHNNFVPFHSGATTSPAQQTLLPLENTAAPSGSTDNSGLVVPVDSTFSTLTTLFSETANCEPHYPLAAVLPLDGSIEVASIRETHVALSNDMILTACLVQETSEKIQSTSVDEAYDKEPPEHNEVATTTTATWKIVDVRSRSRWDTSTFDALRSYLQAHVKMVSGSGLGDDDDDVEMTDSLLLPASSRSTSTTGPSLLDTGAIMNLKSSFNKHLHQQITPATTVKTDKSAPYQITLSYFLPNAIDHGCFNCYLVTYTTKLQNSWQAARELHYDADNADTSGTNASTDAMLFSGAQDAMHEDLQVILEWIPQLLILASRILFENPKARVPFLPALREKIVFYAKGLANYQEQLWGHRRQVFTESTIQCRTLLGMRLLFEEAGFDVFEEQRKNAKEIEREEKRLQKELAEAEKLKKKRGRKKKTPVALATQADKNSPNEEDELSSPGSRTPSPNAPATKTKPLGRLLQRAYLDKMGKKTRTHLLDCLHCRKQFNVLGTKISTGDELKRLLNRPIQVAVKKPIKGIIQLDSLVTSGPQALLDHMEIITGTEDFCHDGTSANQAKASSSSSSSSSSSNFCDGQQEEILNQNNNALVLADQKQKFLRQTRTAKKLDENLSATFNWILYDDGEKRLLPDFELSKDLTAEVLDRDEEIDLINFETQEEEDDFLPQNLFCVDVRGFQAQTQAASENALLPKNPVDFFGKKEMAQRLFLNPDALDELIETDSDNKLQFLDTLVDNTKKAAKQFDQIFLDPLMSVEEKRHIEAIRDGRAVADFDVLADDNDIDGGMNDDEEVEEGFDLAALENEDEEDLEELDERRGGRGTKNKSAPAGTTTKAATMKQKNKKASAAVENKVKTKSKNDDKKGPNPKENKVKKK